MNEVAVGLSGGWNLSNQRRSLKQGVFNVPGATGICQNLPGGTEPHRCYTVSTNDNDLEDRFGAGDLLEYIRQIGRGVPDGKRGLNVTVVPVPDSQSADPVTKQNENIATIRGVADQKTGVYAHKSAPAHGALLARLQGIAGGYDSIIEGNAANAIVTALASVCASTFAHAFINGPNSTEVAAKAARALYSYKRMTMIETGAQIYDEANQRITVGASGIVAGLQAAVDAEHEGIPSHVAGNRALRIAAPGREIDFDWIDPSTEGQRLLNAQCNIIARGIPGEDFAVGEGGMILVAAFTMSNEPLEQLYNVVRMQDFIFVTLVKNYRIYLLQYNMDPKAALSAAIDQTNKQLTAWAQRRIIYSRPRVEFIPDDATPDDWRTGKIRLTGFAEPRAPITRFDLEMQRDTTGIEIEIAEFQSYANNSLL